MYSTKYFEVIDDPPALREFLGNNPSINLSNFQLARMSIAELAKQMALYIKIQKRWPLKPLYLEIIRIYKETGAEWFLIYGNRLKEIPIKKLPQPAKENCEIMAKLYQTYIFNKQSIKDELDRFHDLFKKIEVSLRGKLPGHEYHEVVIKLNGGVAIKVLEPIPDQRADTAGEIIKIVKNYDFILDPAIIDTFKTRAKEAIFA